MELLRPAQTLSGEVTPGESPEDPGEAMIGRRTARRVTLDEPGEVVINGVIGRVTISDISKSGAKLRHPCPPPKGTQGLLRWQNHESRWIVAWSANTGFGVRFLEPSDQLEEAAEAAKKMAALKAAAAKIGASRPAVVVRDGERRTVGRACVDYPCQVRQSSRWVNATLKSISKHGVEICWVPGTEKGQTMQIRGEGLPLLVGEVIRADHETIGCKLSAPLHDAVLDHIVAKVLKF